MHHAPKIFAELSLILFYSPRHEGKGLGVRVLKQTSIRFYEPTAA